jgi:hypothetical protein
MIDIRPLDDPMRSSDLMLLFITAIFLRLRKNTLTVDHTQFPHLSGQQRRDAGV